MKKITHIFSKHIDDKRGGYALITALIFFLTASSAVIAGISDAVFRETRIVRNESSSKQSYFLAESGAEDIAYRIKTNKSYDSNETYAFDTGSTVISVGWNAEGDKEIASVGDVNGTERTVKIVSVSGFIAEFPYVLQGGLGGIDLDGGSTISGDVYTTGSIRGCGTCTITGNVVAAGKSTSVLDQSNALPLPPPRSMTFGSSNAAQDFSQSFKVSSDLSLTVLDLYIKKIGNPSNATVRITTDNSGKPSNTILSSGTLSSSLLDTSYDWETITLTSNPVLTAGTTYWIVVDANTSASNYYIIGANNSLTGGTYTNGFAQTGRYNNNSWSSPPPPGSDGYFKIYIGENEDGIAGENVWNQLPVTSAYSYESTFVNASGDLYCQVGTDNNKPCDTSRGDPIVQAFSVTDEVISSWKSLIQINENSLYEGDYTAIDNDYLYGKKIDGDLIISSGRTVYIGGIVWVTGDVIISGGAEVLYLGSDESGAIIADGNITLGGGAEVGSAGGSSGQLILVSTSSSDPAITINGGANDTLVFAPHGGVLISGGATVNAAVAEHITATGGSTIIYDPSVSKLNVYSEGSQDPYSIKSWKETE